MLDKERLKQMSTWSGFIGIITIISGVLSCISIIGIIPGVISIILGLKLRTAKTYSDEIIESIDENQEGKLNLLISELATYFKIQGILVIVSLIMAVLVVVLGIVGFYFDAIKYVLLTIVPRINLTLTYNFSNYRPPIY